MDRWMDQFVIKGLVLQEIEYGESDLILKVLTAEKGLITVFAKKAMRLRSHLFAACHPLCYSEFVLRPSRGKSQMFNVVEAGYEDSFHDVSYTLEAYAVAMYMVEFTLKLSLVGQPAEKELRLLMNCLYKICEKKIDPKIVKAVFELRMSCECGYMPQLLCCQGCGAYDGDRFLGTASAWTRRTAACSAPPAPPKRAGPATWTRGPCSRCDTSVWPRTRSCSPSASQRRAPRSCSPRRSSTPCTTWTRP